MVVDSDCPSSWYISYSTYYTSCNYLCLHEGWMYLCISSAWYNMWPPVGAQQLFVETMIIWPHGNPCGVLSHTVELLEVTGKCICFQMSSMPSAAFSADLFFLFNVIHGEKKQVKRIVWYHWEMCSSFQLISFLFFFETILHHSKGLFIFSLLDGNEADDILIYFTIVWKILFILHGVIIP